MAALLSLALALMLVASACGKGEREELLVFVAASLTDVMEQLGRGFTEAEGARVSFNVGGSTSLAQQIIRGAPADVFVSAGAQPMNLLEGRGLLAPGTRRDLLANGLVLVAREGRDTGVASVEELATSAVGVAIADPDLSPAGSYAREALESMGLWDTLAPRLILAQDVKVAAGDRLHSSGRPLPHRLPRGRRGPLLPREDGGGLLGLPGGGYRRRGL
jgi:molybdate transport system substrate-binding protein